jgi:hypothetical protein
MCCNRGPGRPRSIDGSGPERFDMNTQPLQSSLFTPAEPISSFDGQTYDAKRDEVRLTGQIERVFDAMKDGVWRSLPIIRAMIEYGSEAGISARLRDLRKGKFGGHTVERRNIGGGMWQYRVVVKAK